MAWAIAHLSDIFAALFGVILAANLIVKLTPTPKDDSVVASIHNLVLKVAGILNVKVAEPTQESGDNPTKPA